METRTLELEQSTALSKADYHLAETLLMRSGGLSLDCAARLKDQSMPAAIATSIELKSSLASLTEFLSDALYSAVNTAKGDPPLQHALLAIRRSVFNGRQVPDASFKHAATHLDASVLQLLNDWTALKQRIDAHAATVERELQRGLVENRRALRQLATIPEFRQGLLLSSPSFERALDDYVRSGDGKQDKKTRRNERTLLSYLLRTTHKTSPFSTLTPVSLARLTDEAWSSGPTELASGGMRTAVRPNLGILCRVAQALRQNATKHPRLRLSIQSAATVEGNRVKYWKRTETPVIAGGPVHTKVSENTFWIHLTQSLNVILDLMTVNGSVTLGGLLNALDDKAGLAQPEASEYIRLLVENGFLELAGLRQAVFSTAYWMQFADELAGTGDEILSGIGGGIRKILALTEEFKHAAGAGRSRILAAIEAETQTLLGLAGNEGPVPHPLIYEDACIGEKPLQVNRGQWDKPLSALAELQRLLSLFDPLIVTKASLRSLFKKRFGIGGECRDLLAFSDYFQEVFYRPYIEATNGGKKAAESLNPFGRGNVNPLRLPEVTALQNARQYLLDKIEARLDTAHDSFEFELAVDWDNDLAADLLRRHGILTNSFFLQVAKEDEEPIFVLNHVYGGFGCMFTRFMHLFEGEDGNDLEQALRANIASLQPEDVLFAELQGGHDTNLNQHRLLTDVELVCPGEQGTLDLDRQVHIGELVLRHDSKTEEVYLFCERLNKRIVPLYLGMLYPLVLPELQTLFLHFAPPTVLKSAFSAKRLPEGAEVLRQPRVRYKQVILERSRWTCAVDAMPARENQEKDYDYLLRFNLWRAQAGIPSEVFALLIPSVPTQPQKPFYVDFEQPLFLLQLEKLASSSSGYLQFSECLPAPHDAILARGGETFVSEFVVDLTQGLSV